MLCDEHVGCVLMSTTICEGCLLSKLLLLNWCFHMYNLPLNRIYQVLCFFGVWLVSSVSDLSVELLFCCLILCTQRYGCDSINISNAAFMNSLKLGHRAIL